jgi:hypothetical protein
MKKLMLFSVIFVLFAGAAFAQAIYLNGWGINAWGRGAFVPMWYESTGLEYGGEPTRDVDKGEPTFKTGTGVTWDPKNIPRVDFRVSAATDFVGFMIHVNSEFMSGTGNGDNGAQIWLKPFGNNWLKLTVANQFIEDALRGKVSTDTGFENFVLGATMMGLRGTNVEPLNQDVTFNRFGGGRGLLGTGSETNVAGANASNTSTHINSALPNVFFLSSSPLDGLFIGLMLQGQYPDTLLEETWRQVHVGAGYEIPKIGHARVQYIGGYMGKQESVDDIIKVDEPSKIEAAFALSAVEDLTVDLGFKFWMPITTYNDRTYNRGLDIGLGAAYKIGDFNLALMAQALKLGAYTGSLFHSEDNDKGADGSIFAVNLIPSYDFSFGTVGLSFIFQTKTADTDTDGDKVEASAQGGPWTQFGVGAWYKRGFAGGSLKAGVTFTPPPIRTGYLASVYDPETGRPGPSKDLYTGFHGRSIITIPIILEYAFF